jgi:pimeloyl-ACP methyl ester carboxylesterase
MNLRRVPSVEGVTHHFVDAGGLRMHVAEAGEGEPLVMLHGWPQHWYMWRNQIPELAKRYRVICPDLRGFGWSDAPPSGYEKETLAQDVLALLDAMGLRRVKLAGHDWGGWCGFLLGLRAPERIERFLALNISPPWGRPTPRALLETWRFWYMYVSATPLGRWAFRERPGYLRRTIQNSSVHPERFPDEDVAEFTRQFREPERANASMQLYRSFVLRELPASVAGKYSKSKLETPTLLMFGTQDFAVPKVLIEADQSRYAEDMRVEYVEDSGHFIAEDKPELVTQRALEFFG